MRVSGSRRALVAAVAVALAAVSSGCDEVKDPYVFDSTPITYTETFTGTLARAGTAFHAFSNGYAGTITITLKTLTPDNTQIVSLDIGTWNGLACTPIYGSGVRNVTQGASFAGSAVAANFCARIFDADSLIPVDTEVTYTMTVEHR